MSGRLELSIFSQKSHPDRKNYGSVSHEDKTQETSSLSKTKLDHIIEQQDQALKSLAALLEQGSASSLYILLQHNPLFSSLANRILQKEVKSYLSKLDVQGKEMQALGEAISAIKAEPQNFPIELQKKLNALSATATQLHSTLSTLNSSKPKRITGNLADEISTTLDNAANSWEAYLGVQPKQQRMSSTR